MADFSNIAFIDDDGNPHPVPVKLSHPGIHDHGVTALAEILLDQFLLEAIEHQAVKDFTLRQADIEHDPLEIFFLDGLVTGELHVGDGGPLSDHDHQDIAIACELNVLEKTGAIEFAN